MPDETTDPNGIKRPEWQDTTLNGSEVLAVHLGAPMRRKEDYPGETSQSIVNRIARTDERVAELRSDAKEVRNDVSDLRAEVHLIRKLILGLGAAGLLGKAGEYVYIFFGGAP
jgi:hypothetical protein